MAKKIKFNLIVDNKPIRNLEELIENFNLDDISKLFENNTLHKWLDVRGYNEHLEKINKIKNLDQYVRQKLDKYL